VGALKIVGQVFEKLLAALEFLIGKVVREKLTKRPAYDGDGLDQRKKARAGRQPKSCDGDDF
jgi:hypothetical protein